MAETMIRLIAGLRDVTKFLEAVNYNWRSAAYIECGICPHGIPGCQDMLFIPDRNGYPLLLPVPDAQLLWGRLLDKSECICTCSRLRFQELYAAWLNQDDGSPERCPLAHAVKRKNKQKIGKQCHFGTNLGMKL